MSRLNKEEIEKLARNLMFSLEEKEIKDIQEEFDTLMKQLDLLEEIDTDGVEEMITPFETPTTYLRDDQQSRIISVDDALLNAPKKEGAYFVIPKVVKE